MPDSSDDVLRIDREDLDLEVELSPTVERTLGDRPRPAVPEHAVHQVGSAGPSFIDIFVEFEVLGEVWRHCRSTTSTEVAGVLLGGLWRDDTGARARQRFLSPPPTASNGNIPNTSPPTPARGAPYIHITRALDARFTHERMSRVTFTHQTWQDLATRMDALGTEEVMVGWYHTHPGYSVFMSTYDQFIHKHFFGPYGVALVVDPLAGDCGFFENVDSVVERVPGFKVVGDPGSDRRLQAFMADLRGAGRPLPLRPRRPAELTVDQLQADAEFQQSQTAFRSFVRRFFGDLAPEPDAFSADVTEANLTIVARGKKMRPGDILKAIDQAVFDVSRDSRNCRTVTVRVRRAHIEGELLCSAEWYQPRRGKVLDIHRQVLTPRMRAMVTWHVPLDRLDITA